MSKIKEFFIKIWSSLIAGLKFVFRKIGAGLTKIGVTKFLKKVLDVLLFLPRKLTENWSYRKRQSAWGVVFTSGLIIGLVYFFVIPFFITIIYSFSRVENLRVNTSTLEHVGVATEWIGLDNFRFILKEHSTFSTNLFNAFIGTIFNVIFILVFSLIIAVLLNSKFKGRAFVRAVFFMPVIFNSQAVDVAMATGAQLASTMETAQMSIFAQGFNMMDFLLEANLPQNIATFLGNMTSQIYDVISYSGVQILIFLAGIQSVPKHLYEAAKIEGATQYEIFWKITFPMVSPLMLTAGVYTVVDSYLRSELLTTINVFSSAGVRNLQRGLGLLTNYGIHAAMSLLFALSSIIIIALVLFGLSKLVFYYDE
jgi:ABC-type sugar transport system permease subunit